MKTGFCHKNMSAESHARCPEVVKNGAGAPKSELTCDCECHKKGSKGD